MTENLDNQPEIVADPALQAASEPMQHPPVNGMNTTPPNNVLDTPPLLPKKRSRLSIVFSVVAGLLILVNLAAVVAAIYLRQNSAKTVPTTPVTPVTPKRPASNEPTVTTLHYVSNALHVEFDYPVDWRISGTVDDKSLSLTSAPFSVAQKDGSNQDGALTLTIADPLQYVALFSETATIVAPSEALTYTQPTKVQRTTTQLSFASSVNYGDAHTIDFVFVSGNLTYRPGQQVSSQNYGVVSPRVSAYIDPCGIHGYRCEGPNDLLFSLDIWHTDPTFVKMRSLIQSLRFSQ